MEFFPTKDENKINESSKHRKEMKKNILKATLVAAFGLIAGVNVYNSQKPDVMSELALANVEALASNGESEGINWRGYYLDLDNSCCKIGRYSDECSGKYTTCGD